MAYPYRTGLVRSSLEHFIGGIFCLFVLLYFIFFKELIRTNNDVFFNLDSFCKTCTLHEYLLSDETEYDD